MRFEIAKQLKEVFIFRDEKERWTLNKSLREEVPSETRFGPDLMRAVWFPSVAARLNDPRWTLRERCLKIWNFFVQFFFKRTVDRCL